MTNKTSLPPVIVPLEAQAHHWASNLATEQSTPENGKRVYLNALAVYAVHQFLEWLEIETDLSAGESGNPYLCGLLDTADLWLPKLGRRLECRPVLLGEIAFTLPTETTTDLMGYVAVQFEESLDQVQLLGFAPAVADDNLPETIPIKNLQPLESLCQSLEELESAEITSKPPKQPDLAGQVLVQLGQWLQGVFEKDWQPPELVLAPIIRGDADFLRSTDSDQSQASVGRAKEIELKDHSIALVVWVMPESEQEEGIRLRVYGSIILPKGLKLEVLDESEEAVMSKIVQQADNWIELEFGIEPRELFSVRVTLDNISCTENFLS